MLRHIILLNIVYNLASFLHNCKIVLISPSQEIHELVVPTYFEEPIIDLTFT